MHDDPLKAVLLWHLNAGHARCCGLQDINLQNLRCREKIIQEVKKEKLDLDTQHNLANRFFGQHNYVEGKLLACSSCGIRALQRGTMQYHTCYLEDINEYFIHGNGDSRYHKYVNIPVNERGTLRNVDVWAVTSWYYSSRLNKTYYFHPELVEPESNMIHGGTDREVVILCDYCHGKDQVPELSIAKGVDFGDYSRIGLERPNVHELIILARVRRFVKYIKIRSNSGANVNYTHCRLQAHVVLFEHDAPVVAAEQLENRSDMMGMIKILLVGPEYEKDMLLQAVKQSALVMARPWVLYQWFLVLQEVNPWYRDEFNVTLPEYDIFKWDVAKINEQILEEAVACTDKVEIDREMAMGSDVARMRMMANESGEAEEGLDVIRQRDGEEDELPVRYSYVTTKINASAVERNNNERMLVGAVAAAVGLTTEYDDSNQQDEDTEEEHVEEEDDGATETTLEIQLPDPENDNENSEENEEEQVDEDVPMSTRHKDILDDYDPSDFGLCGCFPEVFTLGKAYQNSIASITK